MIMTQCEHCLKKLVDSENPHKWTSFNIAQHIKYCKAKGIENSKYDISNFFGKLSFILNN